MVRTPYQPERGDIVWLNFNPQTGNEEAGHRPALVLSPKVFNIATGLIAACPITNQIKGGAFEVVLPTTYQTSGAVLTEQFGTRDWLQREAQFIESVSDDLLAEVLARIAAILGNDFS